MITIWQHGKDESAGEIEDCLTDEKEPFEILRLYETRTVPKNLPSHLIIMGGQMSVNDTGDFPFFFGEQAIIRKMVEQERPVLGICLGAQMIAASFGEQVYPSTPERGWCRITGCHPAWKGLFPENFMVFHWHKETFNLPKGATLISRGNVVKNQVFKIGSALGVQFHPEITHSIIAQWSGSIPGERQTMMSGTEYYLDQSRQRCRDIIDAFIGGWK
jgi:GMP synthase (glutamine-hydrolysing)